MGWSGPCMQPSTITRPPTYERGSSSIDERHRGQPEPHPAPRAARWPHRKIFRSCRFRTPVKRRDGYHNRDDAQGGRSMSVLEAPQPTRAASILAVVCGAAFTINLATTAVNIALPTLARELTASTQQLQWIVDGYNLVFATFVLAAGSLSDRFGRKGALQLGLGIVGVAGAAASVGASALQLIAGQAVMGLGAAIIYPTTLSIISNVYVQPAQRARAIGLWGAVTGVGVATGPIMAGWLIENASWAAIYLCMTALAAVTIAAVGLVVVTSPHPPTPAGDRLGLLLSVLAMATLVYTIIEAPPRGWARTPTLAGFAAAATLLGLFLGWERTHNPPMVDLGLLRNPRFTAA